MNDQFKKSGDGKLTYMPQYNYNNRKSETPVIEVVKERPQKKSDGLSLTTKIKSFIVIISAIILIGIVGRSESDPSFPDRLLILWSLYDLIGCMVGIVVVNILKEVFKKWLLI